jgi:KaiC/GvpD/RAD55 family RecA-like ATPase
MSFNISAVGKGKAVVAAVKAQAEQAKQYQGSEPHHRVVDGVVSIVEALVGEKAERGFVVEAAGHVDSHHAYATITVKSATLAE